MASTPAAQHKQHVRGCFLKGARDREEAQVLWGLQKPLSSLLARVGSFQAPSRLLPMPWFAAAALRSRAAKLLSLRWPRHICPHATAGGFSTQWPGCPGAGGHMGSLPAGQNTYPVYRGVSYSSLMLYLASVLSELQPVLFWMVPPIC